MEQLVAGETMVQLAPPGDAMTVYEAGAPPPTPGASVIVAPESPALTEAIDGALGAAINHCATRVEFCPGIVVAKFAARLLAPSLQPSKVYPVRPKPVAPSKVIFVPSWAFVGAGVAPVLAPLVL